jgi:hypothetical protein
MFSADVWKRFVYSRGFVTEGGLMGQLIHVDVILLLASQAAFSLGVDLTRLLIPVPTNVDLGSAGMACQQDYEGQRPDGK